MGGVNFAKKKAHFANGLHKIGRRHTAAYPITGLPVVLIGLPHPSRHALHIAAIARIAQVWLIGVVGRIALALVARALEEPAGGLPRKATPRGERGSECR